MKNLKGINVAIIPLDNNGYLVQYISERKEEPIDEDPGLALMRALNGRGRNLSEMENYYASDSRKVAEIIQDLIDTENTRGRKAIPKNETV